MKKLIITADDFGANSRVNEAVERLHKAGLITQASLMVNEPGAAEAVRIAQRNPGLTVGLHLTLCTDSTGKFLQNPALAGLYYLLDPRTGKMLDEEIEQQFERFVELGFVPHYFDGHTHIHLNPAVFPRVLPVAGYYRFRAMRLVREWGSMQPKPFILRHLSERVRHQVALQNIRFTDGTFGVSCTGRSNTSCVKQILNRIPDGLSEFYFHPGAEREEPDAEPLCEILRARSIVLTSWRELPAEEIRRAAKESPESGG